MPVRPVEIVYSAEHELSLDLYLAADPARAPVVVYVHGGGFQRGDKRDHPTRLQALVSMGLNVASINYRLAPAWTYPAPVDDVRRAVSALRSGDGWGFDASSIGVIGVSAGGYLAAAAALSAADPASAIQAVSVWFAGLDLVESSRRSPLEARIAPVVYERALLGEAAGEEAFQAAASPARWSLGDAPPFLIIHGDSDKIVPPAQSLAFHDALARHGRETTLVRLGLAGHEDPAFDQGPVPAMVAAWMRARLRPEPTPTDVAHGERHDAR